MESHSMVEEQHYRQACQDINPAPCPYERSILTPYCACEKSQPILIAERESCNCTAADMQENCQSYLHYVRSKASFALKETRSNEPLPYSKEMKIQCGGLLGLQSIIDHSNEQAVENVHQLMSKALQQYSCFEELPMEPVLKAINQFQIRRRRGSNIP
jgi:hypothetical protein